MNWGGARPWGRRVLFCLKNKKRIASICAALTITAIDIKTNVIVWTGGNTECPNNKQKLQSAWCGSCAGAGLVDWSGGACESALCSEIFATGAACDISVIGISDMSAISIDMAWWDMAECGVTCVWTCCWDDTLDEVSCEKTESSSQTPYPTRSCCESIGVKNTDSCISHAANASKTPSLKGDCLNRSSVDNDLPSNHKM